MSRRREHSVNGDASGVRSRKVAEAMDAETAASLERQLLMPTYRRAPVVFERGEGCYLYDSTGRRYLDFVAGIATVSLGHCNSELQKAIEEQARQLWHTSNLYYTEPQLRLAEKLRGIAGWGKAFFASSGAEAVECALKLVRKYWHARDPQRKTVVSFDNSFHGRTIGALSLTGQPSKRRPFEPLLPDVAFADPSDPAPVLDAHRRDAAAVFVELVQGEGGVRPIEREAVDVVKDFCRNTGALLVIDEVQTGLCRTGSWFAWADPLWGELEPDVFTLGKALGNGAPVSACLAKEEVADAFEPGDHATTLGGNPLVSSIACKVLEIMERDRLFEPARRMGGLLVQRLRSLDGVCEVRGRGLLIAAEVNVAASRVAEEALARGLLVNPVTPTAVRLTPPLVVSEQEIDQAVEILAEALTVGVERRSSTGS